MSEKRKFTHANLAQPVRIERLFRELLTESAWQQFSEGRDQSLFDEYGIDRADPNCWKNLALALAMEFVPSYRLADPGTRGRGRPKSVKPRIHKKRARGPKPKLRVTDHELVSAIDTIKKKHHLKGHGSDKKALVIYRAKDALAAAFKLNQLQPRLSRARRKLQ